MSSQCMQLKLPWRDNRKTEHCFGDQHRIIFFSEQIIYSRGDRLSSLSEALAWDLVVATDSLCYQYAVYPSIKWAIRQHLGGAVLGLDGQSEKPWKAAVCTWFTDALKLWFARLLIQRAVVALNIYLYYMSIELLIAHIASVLKQV